MSSGLGHRPERCIEIGPQLRQNRSPLIANRAVCYGATPRCRLAPQLDAYRWLTTLPNLFRPETQLTVTRKLPTERLFAENFRSSPASGGELPLSFAN
jgi:hypothetical protein